MKVTKFYCSVCRKHKAHMSNITTGYGVNEQGRKVCFDCCGKADKAEMVKTGRATLYLTLPSIPARGLIGVDGKVTNWPGTLEFMVEDYRRGRHNMAGVRHDVWFHGPDRQYWHGVQYGDNTQLCHCKRLKSA